MGGLNVLVVKGNFMTHVFGKVLAASSLLFLTGCGDDGRDLAPVNPAMTTTTTTTVLGTEPEETTSSSTTVPEVKQLSLDVLENFDPYVQFDQQGGDCGNPYPIPCATTLQIDVDGNYVSFNYTNGSFTSGTLTSGAMRAVNNAVDDTDFNEVRNRPEPESCPTFVDGQERMIAVHTPGPAAVEPQTLYECQHTLEPLALLNVLETVEDEVPSHTNPIVASLGAGGLCPSNSPTGGKVCVGMNVWHTDVRVTAGFDYDNFAYLQFEPFTQTPELTEAVAGLTETDVVTGKFAGTCPSAYDGQEVVWLFHPGDNENGFTVSNCQSVLNSDLPVWGVLGVTPNPSNP